MGDGNPAQGPRSVIRPGPGQRLAVGPCGVTWAAYELDGEMLAAVHLDGRFVHCNGRGYYTLDAKGGQVPLRQQHLDAIRAVPPPEALAVHPAHADLVLNDSDRAALGSGDEGVVEPRADQIRHRLLTPSQLAYLPPPQPLIEGILLRDTLAAMYGKPGSAKSFLALDWGLSVATGALWFGHEVHQGNVLYIAAEGVAGLPARVQAWERARHVVVGDDFGITWLANAVPLLRSEWVDGLVVVLGELQPQLVIIDTLARSIAGGDENGPKDMTALVEASDRLRRVNGSTVLLVHHTPKDGSTLRGHSSLEGAVDTAIEVRASDRVVTVVSAKAKDLPLFPNIKLVLAQVGESCALYSHDHSHDPDELMESERALLEGMGAICGSDGLSATTLMSAINMPASTFYRALKALHGRGVVANVGTTKKPRWTLPGEGQQ